MQVPAWHVPFEHAAPSGLAGLEQLPDCASQIPGSWQASSAAHITGAAPVQAPAWHVSLVVQALPSSQLVPSGFADVAQAPVAGLQVALWHASGAAQLTAVPEHTPAWQVSVVVQRLLSLQLVPLARAALPHVPPALHAGMAWQGLVSRLKPIDTGLSFWVVD